MAYLIRTGREDGLAVLNELPPETAVRLLDANPRIQRQLVAAWRRSDEVDAGTVAEVVDVADDLDARRTAALGDLLDQEGAVRLVAEEGVDAGTMRGILDADAGRAAVDLYDDLGVSGRRIDELVEAGIDLRKHESGLRIYVASGKTIRQEGDIAEIIAHERITRRVRNGEGIFDESKSYIVYPTGKGKGIEVFDETGQDIGEFDHLVTTQDGDVVAVYETKLPADKAIEAKSQLADLLSSIDRNGIDSSRTSFGFKGSQFEGDVTRVTVGPKEGSYNLKLNYGERQLRAILETIRKEGL